MPTCVGLRTEKIRSTIELSGVTIKTPYVKAFNVEEDREKLANTFSATVEVPVTSSFVPGSDIVIYAGEKDNEEKIFTGEVRSITVQPSFDKAGYFNLSLAGRGKIGELENRTFSRRLRSDGFSLFVSITGGPSNRPTRGVSIDKRIRGGQHQTTSSSPRPTGSEHTKLTKMPKRGGHKHGIYSKAGTLDDWRKGEDTGLTVHDHTAMNKGGPAWAVYSSD